LARLLSGETPSYRVKAERRKGIEMKKLSAKSALLLTGLVALAFARPAAAQNSNLFRVNVPFSFTAGQLAFPAGDYRINVDTDHGMLHIDSLGGRATGIVRVLPGSSSRPETAADRGVLRFAKYGDHYFLTGLWKAGYVQSNRVLVSERLLNSAKAGEVHDVASNNLP
jgi:hypothetical protein